VPWRCTFEVREVEGSTTNIETSVMVQVSASGT
jgi:hypothetical protein